MIRFTKAEDEDAKKLTEVQIKTLMTIRRFCQPSGGPPATIRRMAKDDYEERVLYKTLMKTGSSVYIVFRRHYT